MNEFTIEQISEDNIIDGQALDISPSAELIGNSVYYVNDNKLFHFDIRSKLTTQLLNDENISSLRIEPLEADSSILTANFRVTDPDSNSRLNSTLSFDGVIALGSIGDTNFSIAKSDEYLVWTESEIINGDDVDPIRVYNAKDKTITTIAGAETVSDDGFLLFFERDLAVSGSNVAWIGGGQEIYFYNGNTVVKLTDLTNSRNLVNDGNNFVWFSSFGEFDPDLDFRKGVFLYDTFSINQIWELPRGKDNRFVDEPQIFGNNIAWYALEDKSDGERKLSLYAYNGNETNILYEVSASGFNTSYTDSLNVSALGVSFTDINDTFYLYDGNQTLQLSEPLQINDDLGFFGDRITYEVEDNAIAWVTFDANGRTQLYYYGGQEVVQLTNYEPVENSQFNLELINYEFSDDGIFWVSEDNQSQNQLFFYDGANISQITSLNSDEGSIRDFDEVDGNVIWTTQDSQRRKIIYFYDGEDVTQLYRSEDDFNDDIGEIEVVGNKVVWTADDPQGQEQLYLYDGEDVTQITNLEDDRRNVIADFEVLSDGIVWIANDDGDNSDDFIRNGEVFFLSTEDEFFETLI